MASNKQGFADLKYEHDDFLFPQNMHGPSMEPLDRLIRLENLFFSYFEFGASL